VVEPLLQEPNATLLCSVHGLPITYVQRGDPYQTECERSLAALQARLPQMRALLGYQSQFGKGEWLKPSTAQLCDQLEGRVIVVPLSFTSDHLETLYEIEQEYLPRLRQRGVECKRLPAVGLDSRWVAPLLLSHHNLSRTQSLVRQR
jgi:protoporphyrin/coproporphyrin ferrochelatase